MFDALYKKYENMAGIDNFVMSLAESTGVSSEIIKAACLKQLFGDNAKIIQDAHELLEHIDIENLAANVEKDVYRANEIKKINEDTRDTLKTGKKEKLLGKAEVQQILDAFDSFEEKITHIETVLTTVQIQLNGPMMDKDFLIRLLDDYHVHALMEEAVELTRQAGLNHHAVKMEEFTMRFEQSQQSVDKLKSVLAECRTSLVSARDTYNELDAPGDKMEKELQTYEDENHSPHTTFTQRIELEKKVINLNIRAHSWLDAIRAVTNIVRGIKIQLPDFRKKLEVIAEGINTLSKDVTEHEEKPKYILQSINQINQAISDISAKELPNRYMGDLAGITQALKEIKNMETSIFEQVGALKSLLGTDNRISMLEKDFQRTIDQVVRHLLLQADILTDNNGYRGAFQLIVSAEYQELARQGKVPVLPTDFSRACTMVTRHGINNLRSTVPLVGLLSPDRDHIDAAFADETVIFQDYRLVADNLVMTETKGKKDTIGGDIVLVPVGTHINGFSFEALVLPIPSTSSYKEFCQTMWILAARLGWPHAICPDSVHDPFEDFPKDGWTFQVVCEGI